MATGTAGGGTVLDAGTRQRTRVVLLFNLNGTVPVPDPARDRLVDCFSFGRFQPHLESGEAVLPIPVLSESAVLGLGLPDDHGLTRSSVSLLLVVAPRGDATLLLDCEFEGDTEASAVASWLATTCFDRKSLKLNGQPLLDVLTRRLGLTEPLSYGRDVHQLVFPGGRLREDLLSQGDENRQSALLNNIVYRGMMPAQAAGLPVSRPPNLSNHGATLSANGRGVSVQAGWSRHVEDGMTVVALCMISALAVLRRTRLAAFTMMRRNERASTGSPQEVRGLISSLSNGVNELQLDLAFGVEAYIDSLLIPEMIMSGFQRSLSEAFGISESLDNSARMVERLTSVISARSAVLDAKVAERDEKQNRIISVLVAAATLIALPPALLLAFFGVNATEVDGGRSILDLGRYGAAYALAWLPFVLLVVYGYLRLRRVSRDETDTPQPASSGS